MATRHFTLPVRGDTSRLYNYWCCMGLRWAPRTVTIQHHFLQLQKTTMRRLLCICLALKVPALTLTTPSFGAYSGGPPGAAMLRLPTRCFSLLRREVFDARR